jgi:hypothetical protein
MTYHLRSVTFQSNAHHASIRGPRIRAIRSAHSDPSANRLDGIHTFA